MSSRALPPPLCRLAILLGVALCLATGIARADVATIGDMTACNQEAREGSRNRSASRPRRTRLTRRLLAWSVTARRALRQRRRPSRNRRILRSTGCMSRGQPTPRIGRRTVCACDRGDSSERLLRGAGARTISDVGRRTSRVSPRARSGSPGEKAASHRARPPLRAY